MVLYCQQILRYGIANAYLCNLLDMMPITCYTNKQEQLQTICSGILKIWRGVD
jgi:hypothetical protein